MRAILDTIFSKKDAAPGRKITERAELKQNENFHRLCFLMDTLYNDH